MDTDTAAGTQTPAGREGPGWGRATTDPAREGSRHGGGWGHADGAGDRSARLATAPGPSAFCTIVISPSVRWSGF